MAEQSYKIGKIFGIDIELHWTFIMLILLTLLLSTYVFILMVLLFVCVLIHELLHSIVSLRNNVNVRKIILLPMGGASIIDPMEMDPKVEFNISIAGPLMSLLLGSVFGFFVAFSPPGPLTQVLQFLFQINILLGVFNLLPAFPTDGGRVFRSYLERRYNAYKATMITITAGKYVMALFLIGTLVFVMLITAPLYYKEFVFLWNIIIVFFLYGGAQAEKELAEVRKEAKGVSVKDVVSKHFSFVPPERKVRELYGIVKRTKMHLLLTKVGSDYAYLDLLRKERLGSATFAKDIATKIPTIGLDTNVVDALEVMEANDSGIAAVTSRSRLVGIITLSHLRSFLSLHVISKKRE